MLTELRKRIDEHSENFTRNIKYTQSEMKNSRDEIKKKKQSKEWIGG